jgi:hypothetical protein
LVAQAGAAPSMSLTAAPGSVTSMSVRLAVGMKTA